LSIGLYFVKNIEKIKRFEIEFEYVFVSK
jgi:hypothetical protein